MTANVPGRLPVLTIECHAHSFLSVFAAWCDFFNSHGYKPRPLGLDFYYRLTVSTTKSEKEPMQKTNFNMIKKKAAAIITIFLGFACLSTASDLDLQELTSLKGTKYIKARDAFLKTAQVYAIRKSDDARIILQKEILNSRQKYPGLAKQLEGIIATCYKTKTSSKSNKGLEASHLFLVSESYKFMNQGIEAQEFVTYKNPTGLLGDTIEVKHAQSKDKVAQIKQVNQAARLVVIEFLWKISTDKHITYELSESCYQLCIRSKFSRSYLPAFKDIFKKSTYSKIIEVCLNIFIETKDKKVISLLRPKLESMIEKEDYKSCCSIIRVLEILGTEDDVSSISQLKAKVSQFELKQKQNKKMRKTEDINEKGHIP